MLIDDENLHVKYDDAEKAGYDFEKGRQRAIKEKSAQNLTDSTKMKNQLSKKTSKLWLWVLGWIFIFPVPLTILIFRTKKIDKKIRMGIIATVWIIYFLMVIFYKSSSDKNTNLTDVTIESSQAPSTEKSSGAEKSIGTEKFDGSSVISDFVDAYNSAAQNKLKFKENFNVSDTLSEHYKTEFRLGAYEDAIGKSYKLNNGTMDIVVRDDIVKGSVIRLYASKISIKMCCDIVNTASPILDKNISKKDVKEATNYITANKEVNGFYYGNLGIVMLKNNTNGYDLMVKLEND
jgi:hypothetical protein